MGVGLQEATALTGGDDGYVPAGPPAAPAAGRAVLILLCSFLVLAHLLRYLSACRAGAGAEATLSLSSWSFRSYEGIRQCADQAVWPGYPVKKNKAG